MDTVKAGRIEIPLTPGQGGLVLGGADDRLGPLRAVINASFTGAMLKDLRRVLNNGERSAGNQAVAIARPSEEDLDLTALRLQWTAVSGESAGDDVYVLETLWDRQRMVVPRAVLLEIMDQLEVFRRANPPEHSDGALDYVEAKAREADEAAGTDTSGAKVKVVLAYLESNGFFDPVYREANRTRLLAGNFPVLESYLRAVEALQAYYRSPERAEYVQPLDSPPVVGGPVSLEWFRRGVPVPEGMHPFRWLAFNEWLLRTAHLNPQGAGEFYPRVGGRSYQLRFRREDGEHPALTWAEMLR